MVDCVDGLRIETAELRGAIEECEGVKRECKRQEAKIVDLFSTAYGKMRDCEQRLANAREGRVKLLSKVSRSSDWK